VKGGIKALKRLAGLLNQIDGALFFHLSTEPFFKYPTAAAIL
jgi:hypothetical protein